MHRQIYIYIYYRERERNQRPSVLNCFETSLWTCWIVIQPQHQLWQLVWCVWKQTASNEWYYNSNQLVSNQEWGSLFPSFTNWVPSPMNQYKLDIFKKNKTHLIYYILSPSYPIKWYVYFKDPIIPSYTHQPTIFMSLINVNYMFFGV